MIAWECTWFIRCYSVYCMFLVPTPCRQGTFGELQVFYTVEELSVTVLATNDGTPAINYFSTVPSTTLPSNFISSSTTTSTLSPSTECAERCLSELDCRSFFVDRSIPPVCHLSRSTSDIGILQEGSTVYDKLVNRVRPAGGTCPLYCSMYVATHHLYMRRLHYRAV